jgi:hypothetical protein
MSSKRKQSRALHGRNGERDILRANPIIAAVERTLQGRRPLIAALEDGTLIFHRWDSPTPFGFSDETIREVGDIVCQALLAGDPRIVKIVKDAIKQADHLFSRDREPELVRRVFMYLGTREAGPILDLKKEIETRCNGGMRLQQHRWNRIRKSLGLPRLPTGAAAGGYKRKSRRRV